MKFTIFDTDTERHYRERMAEERSIGFVRLSSKWLSLDTTKNYLPTRPGWKIAFNFFRYGFLTEDDRLDLTQETYCRLLEKYRNGGKIHSLKKYVRKIAVGVLSEFIDEREGLSDSLDFLPGEDLGKGNTFFERCSGLHADLPHISEVHFRDWIQNTFNDLELEVIRLMWAGYSRAETARKMGIKGGRVTRIIRYAYTKIPTTLINQ